MSALWHPGITGFVMGDNGRHQGRPSAAVNAISTGASRCPCHDDDMLFIIRQLADVQAIHQLILSILAELGVPRVFQTRQTVSVPPDRFLKATGVARELIAVSEQGASVPRRRAQSSWDSFARCSRAVSACGRFL